MFTYKDSGVGIDRAQGIVREIERLQASTMEKRKLVQAFGLFAAGLDISGYRTPVLFAACDGVGSKLFLQKKQGLLQYAGIDLVAMNVNDILTSNAFPVMFLDYIGVSRIKGDYIKPLIEGIVQGCRECDCILAGGETAEMPGIVNEDVPELSGFCCGIGEKERLANPLLVKDGDILVSIPSAGLHANGFTLVRKIIETCDIRFSDKDMKDILTPTRIYFKEVKKLYDRGVDIKAMAHITGGGIPENLRRVVPAPCGAHVRTPGYKNERINRILRFVEKEEQVNTFNMGTGYIFIVSPDDVQVLLNALPDAFVSGEIIGDNNEIFVEVSDG